MLRVPTDRNSPDRLNYSNQPSRSFQWRCCLRLRQATVVGPQGAAFPLVSGEMTPLTQLRQPRRQGSVGWACKAVYGGLVSKGATLTEVVWGVRRLRPPREELQQRAEHTLSFGRVFAPACSRFALVQGRAGAGRIRPVCISLC